MQSTLQVENRSDYLDLASVVFALLDVLADPFGRFDIPAFLVGLNSQFSDLCFTLAEKVAQEDLRSLIGDKRFVIVPNRARLKGHIRWFLGLADIVAQEHERIEVWDIPWDFVE